MKKAILFFVLSVFALSCSPSDDDGTDGGGGGGTGGVTPDIKMKIDGIEVDFPNTSTPASSSGATKQGDVYSIGVAYGQYTNYDTVFGLRMNFSSEGKLISGSLSFNSQNNGNPGYGNFIYFPSNYMEVSEFSVNEATKRIKLKFKGRLYNDQKSINSESRLVEAEVDMNYTEVEPNPYPIVIDNIEQYCRAKINGTPWFARFEHDLSSFTNEDAYKIEINFANSPTPGSYNFTSASTSNYVKFSKFNTTTLTYDYYDVTGQVAYSYREYHGYTNYSFIGTYSFTAVNPNNPADVIQVTDGTFRSYQKF